MAVMRVPPGFAALTDLVLLKFWMHSLIVLVLEERFSCGFKPKGILTTRALCVGLPF